MKFGYSYKTSDGVRHESFYHADAKEDVFADLRKKGIRPIKVWEIAPKHPALRRTFTYLAVIAPIVAVAAIAWYALAGRRDPDAPFLVKLVGLSPRDSRPQYEDRSQIYGDPGILQTCELKEWSNVFEDEGERFLARFAQPGLPVRLLGTAWRKVVADALKAKPGLVPVSASDGAEIAKMKRIVNGMKRELAQYVADSGTAEEYIVEVLQRQSIEEKIVINFKAEFEKLERDANAKNRDEIVSKWNAKNVLLRQMGLRTVLIPERIEGMDE
ncbi:MAG: hypothetical protein IJ658_13440 [Kiritimatiellae bacterium]|nr:hypothetical protein [Kiritimatiellia bacterium]